MATSKVDVTPGVGKVIATYSISEDSVTKEIQRVGLSDSTGADTLGLASATPGANTVLDRLRLLKLPIAYAKVVGSPFTLTSAWVKVATTTVATRGLRISPVVSAVNFDIEWVSVDANATAPTLITEPNGEGVLGGEEFISGLPLGDIYLKSVTGQVAIVKTGV